MALIRLPSGRRQADEGQTVIFATEFDKNDEVTTPTRAECDKSPSSFVVYAIQSFIRGQ